MRSADLEFWARAVIERGAQEDALVECKSQWPVDYHKAARRIAGHCNAARGEPVLWIIGVTDEGDVVGADDIEIATWWQQVIAKFDGPNPALQHLVMHENDKPVALMLFDTEQAPFVVRTKDAGYVHREVPWRDATSIRSATRSDLLRLLIPRQHLPKLEVTGAYATYDERDGGKIHATINVYATLPLGNAIVIPHHQVSGRVSLPTMTEIFTEDVYCAAGHHAMSLTVSRFSVGPEPVATVHQGVRQVILEGPGFFRIHMVAPCLEPVDAANSVQCDLALAASLRPAGSDATMHVEATLHPDLSKRSGEDASPRWSFGVPM